jgi:synaptobrevin family protein YKT6
MKVLGISILRYNADCSDPIMLVQAAELTSFGFFQRGTVKEMIIFFSKTIAKRTPPGQRQSG